MDHIKNCIQGRNRKGIMVGITSRCSEYNLKWLKDFLTEKFQDLILDVEYFLITNTNGYEWEKNVNKYSAAILYHTKLQGRVNITDVDGSIYNEELSYLCQKLGREKVLVLLDDMEDTSEEEVKRILEIQPSLKQLSSHLILIPEIKKYGAASRKRKEFLTVLGAEQTTSCPDENILDETNSRTRPDDDNIWGNGSLTSFVTTRPAYKDPSSSLAKYRICIFSRSKDDNYQWLVRSLQTTNTGRSVDVRSVYISNNFQLFYSEMLQCNFAILYHTKKQGRLNITDVTDSLYDQELREMFEYLGKENVIVVADDVMDASNAEKQRILKNQPSIGSLAKDLFLFGEQQKDCKTLLEIMTLTQRNVGVVDENCTMKASPVSALQYKAAQEEVEQHPQPSQNTSNESILMTNDDNGDDGLGLYHSRGTTRYKIPGSKYETTSVSSDIYTSRKRPNYSPCAHDHEEEHSKKNIFEQQESKKILLDAISISDDTRDTASCMDNQLRVLNDTGSVFFARLSEFSDSWRSFQRAVQNPQSEIQQLLSKTHTQVEELKEKDIVISNLRKSFEEKDEKVYHLQREIEDKQRMIEEKDKLIQELQENRDRPVDKMEERRDRLEHQAENLEEIIQEKEKLQGEEKAEGLPVPLRKRRGAKKWTSEDMNEQDGGLDASNTSEPETMENHSTLEFLWRRITELEIRVKHLEYTTGNQRHELDKYRQTVKEQSSQINEYEELVNSLLNKTEHIRKI